MNNYKLVRIEDESGVSGTGHVADIVEFHNGKCVMCWRTSMSSIAIYDSLYELEKIHGHGGKTKVVPITK